MIRRYFRRVLPTHESVRSNRYVSRLGPWLHQHNLWQLNRRGVAGGVAAGMLAGIVPGSNPVQFLAAAVLAVRFRVNLPIAMTVTLYSNPFTVLPIYYAAFRLGQLLTFERNGGLPSFDPPSRQWGALLHYFLDWVSTVGKPLLVGLPALGLLLAVLGYVLVDVAWRVAVRYGWQQRRKRRHRRL